MVAPQTPKAMPRSRPRNVALSRDSEVGSIIAPPMPWSARAPISVPPLWATAASTLDTPKIAAPIVNSRRRPKLSASRPNTSSSAAKTSV